MNINDSVGSGHMQQNSDDIRSHALRVSIMNQLATEHPDWTVEQIQSMAKTMQEQQRQNSQYLMEQTQGATSTAAFIQSVPQQQQQQQQRMANGMLKPVTPSTRAMMTMWNQPNQNPMQQQMYANQQQMEQKQQEFNANNVASRDLLEQMRQGTVMVCNICFLCVFVCVALVCFC